MAPSRNAVLLVNLGSPAAPTAAAVERFLEEFLSDRRVVDLNPWLWALLRKLIVLPRRSQAVAHAYASIWTPEGSPLVVNTRALCAGLRERVGPELRVEIAMRYGEPSLRSVVAALARDGVEHVSLVPLFPQHSEATTGSILAEMAAAVAALPRPLAWTPLRTFHADPGYVAALAATVRESLALGPVDHFVWSFHGLPLRFIERGDPYADESRKTARALARELGLRDDQWSVVWQSRFGRRKWLEPAADRFVPELAREHKRVLIACPAFTADCLETLEEISVRLRAAFLAAGGEELRVVPCLNAHPRWIEALAKLCEELAASSNGSRVN
ncbi:MAG TPA: ferrochelatase [Planctomycetota bacterium]|nr:ferrochelatase [Planctomycetota bacterium]